MEFSVNKTDITEAVGNIQRVVSGKTSIPALEGILIQAGENGLRMTAYDLEMSITTVVSASVREPGKTVLDAKKFSDIVRHSPAETLTVLVDDKDMAEISSGAYVTQMPGIPAQEFPELPKVTDYTKLTMPGNVLKSMIRQTMFAIAESDAKPIHQGSLFNIEQGILDVVSVDGYRLAKRTEPISFDEDISFVVPGKTLSELLKLIKDNDDPVDICPGKRHILFTIENYTVISSLLEGEFLNYKAAIPADSQTEVILNTRMALDSVGRVSLLITDRLKSPVRCLFDDNLVKLSCTTAGTRTRDEMPVEMTGQSVEIGFNNRYLLDALRNTECDEVKAQLGGPLSPMKIVPKEGDSFLFLVLPVRLKSE